MKCLSFVDVFQTGIWSELQNVQHPHLRDLAARLPAIALQSRKAGTLTNYRYGWIRWRNWASQFNEVIALPANPLYVALYLLDIYQTSRTAAPVNVAYYSISWAHRTAGLIK